MTHVLIPIKDIEERIKLRKELEPQDDRSQGIVDGEIGVLTELLTFYKQISLDEKDIEEKANQIASRSTPFHDGYKQALKDLI